MGFAVLHIQKAKGNDSGTTAHIERTVSPANADIERTPLNQNLIRYPDGVETRTQAIQYRIENAGIKRKISHNQVRALQVMLSGTPEDMHRIQAAGKLDEWCRNNIKWLRETFGEDNVVSAVLHMDEKTPHIHATVVPIVTGERRKARKKKKVEKPQQSAQGSNNSQPDNPENSKKAYRKKDPNAARLCADDIVTRENLEYFQDSYAQAMNKYGLQRGIKGSDARHIATPQYYRDVYAKSEGLKADIADLEETRETRQQEVAALTEQERQARTRTEQATAEKQQAETQLTGKQSELQKVRSELKTEKFKSSAAEAGTKFANTIGSLLGSSKIDRQQQEIDNLKAENEERKQEITRLTQTIARERSEHQKAVGDLKAQLDKIDEWFPDTKPLIKMGEYCRNIGFSDTQAKDLIAMRPVRFTGELYSHEFTQRFKATDADTRLEKHDNFFRLLTDGMGIVQWFSEKHRELLLKIGIKVPERRQNMGKKIGSPS